MKIIDYCVCCDSKNIVFHSAKMSIFTYDRMLGIKSPKIDRPCQGIECLNCGYVGSDIRFNFDEESRFYFQYMGKDYNNHRCSYDGEHMRHLLESYARDSTYKSLRKEMMMSCLRQIDINLDNIQSVLDFGGADGSLFPDIFNNSKKYIVDIDKQNIVGDVTSISNSSECDPVDLVLCSHTLEHVSYPVNVINEIKKYMKSGSWLYIEVPDNEPPNTQFFTEHINVFRLPVLIKLLQNTDFINIKGFHLSYNHWLLASSISVIAQVK